MIQNVLTLNRDKIKLDKIKEKKYSGVFCNDYGNMIKIILQLLLLTTILFGTEIITDYTKKVEKVKKNDTLWVPLVFYTPDTNFGALGMVMHFSGNDLYLGTLMYTIDNQGMGLFKGGWNLFSPKIYGDVTVMATRFPKKFFWVGDDTSLKDEVVLTRRHLKIQGVFNF